MSQTIGVVGAGTMGNGIAQTAAGAGFDVVMCDISTEFVERGIANISKPCSPNMKVIWTLKNKPSPHIHDKATEFPHSSAFIQRKFMKTAKEAPFRRWSKLDSRGTCRRAAT